MNKMTLECLAHLENEAFIRTSAIAFLMPLNFERLYGEQGAFIVWKSRRCWQRLLSMR